MFSNVDKVAAKKLTVKCQKCNFIMPVVEVKERTTGHCLNCGEKLPVDVVDNLKGE